MQITVIMFVELNLCILGGLKFFISRQLIGKEAGMVPKKDKSEINTPRL